MIANIETLKEKVQHQLDDNVRDDVQQAVMDGRTERGHHTELGLLCEQAGLMALAFSEFQLALRDDRDDPVASFHLAQHYRERGDVDRSLGLLERLLDANPTKPDWLALYVEICVEEQARPRAKAALARAKEAGLSAEYADRLCSMLRPDTELTQPGPKPPAEERTEEKEESSPLPSDADCVRFHTLFSGREGVYARQWAKRGGKSGYSPVHEPLTPAVVRNHLLGTYTLGVYPVRLDGTATFFALDLDIDKSALQRARGDHAFAETLRESLQQEGPRLVQVLRDLGCEPVLENSGYKGRHLWVFLEESETAGTLHLLGRLLLAWQAPLLPPHLHLEFFPKQARLKGKGLGNLIKLPLGVHRRTGRRSLLLDATGNQIADPFAALRQASRTPKSVLHAAIDHLKGTAPRVEEPKQPEEPESEPAQPPEPPVSPPVTLPDTIPAWTEADFETDRRVKHMLEHCPVLAELKRMVDEYRQLSHQEQLVLTHSLGHVEGGPQAVNYLLAQCVDVGPEKFMKSRLKGNPVSCPSIRKKIPHVTRRVACNCPFEYAKDRYPTPTLHLLTLPDPPSSAPRNNSAEPLVKMAQRFAVLDCRRKEMEQEWAKLRDGFLDALRAEPEQYVSCPGGRFRIVQIEGVEELVWESEEEESKAHVSEQDAGCC